MLPQVGISGGTPRPRKLSAASEMMAEAMEKVPITTADGKPFTKRVDVPKGDPRDPMTQDEIAIKFGALGRDVVGESCCNEIGQTVMHLDELSSVDELMQLTVK